jgi:hypothetical protein
MIFGDGIVLEKDCMKPEECADVCTKVLSLQNHWENRRGPYQFHTLGCAAYLDGAREGHQYPLKSKTTNPFMKENFSSLYEQIRVFMGTVLDAPAYFDETYAYPGFHLFALRGDEIDNDDPGNRAHFDYQFAKIFEDHAQRPSNVITFTLPLMEPSCGSSLEMWDLRPEGHKEINYQHIPWALRNKSRTVNYQVGRMFIHDGLNLHAIGRVRGGSTGRRITLQGHGFRRDKGWLLYW